MPASGVQRVGGGKDQQPMCSHHRDKTGINSSWVWHFNIIFLYLIFSYYYLPNSLIITYESACSSPSSLYASSAIELGNVALSPSRLTSSSANVFGCTPHLDDSPRSQGG